MALLSISAGLVLYFKETHYFCRFKILMESMFSGDEFLPFEKYFESGIFCHKFSILKKCQQTSQSPKIWKGGEDFYFHIFNIAKFG
jgi:hypothetical protein